MIFLDRIIAVFNKYPHKNAFCIQNKVYTYSDIASYVSAFQEIIEKHYNDEQNIGIVVSDNVETYSSILAVLLSGKTYVPINPNHPEQRTGQIIQQAGLKIAFSNTGLQYLGIAIVNTSTIVPPAGGSEFIAAASKPDEVNAYILFTSGSTGIPKGVPITYRNLDSFVNAFFALGYQIDGNDRFLQMFDLTFDLSVMSYLLPLCLGACVYTVPDSGMKYANVYNVLDSHSISFALMVPSILAYLKPYFSEVQLPHLRYSLFCGEALYKDLVQEWMNCVPNATIENVYGPTEATIFCMAYNVKNSLDLYAYNEIVSIGTAMNDMEAIVVDDHLQILADGNRGELCLHGGQVSPGYLDPTKNVQAFFKINEKKYYRTGDITYKGEEGNFMYCGRADQQVKIQGYRIELSEIEFHLRKISGNVNVVAIAINAVNSLTRIDAVFEDGSIDAAAVITELKTKLPVYMIPSQVHFIAPFPLNANGKTDRKALEKMITASL